MVREGVVKKEGDKRLLVIDYKGANITPDVAEHGVCMRDVVENLQSNEVDEVVLVEYYERIYDEEQTRMLKGVADVVTKFENENVWSPSRLGVTRDAKVISERHDRVLEVFNLLFSDPVGAYFKVLQLFKEQSAAVVGSLNPEDDKAFLATVVFIKGSLDSLLLIRKMKDYVSQLGRVPEGRLVYRGLFESGIKPSFIGSRVLFTGTETLELVDEYEVEKSKIYIYKHPERIEFLYYINPPEYTLSPEKYFLLEKTKEVVSERRPGDVGFMDMEQARKYFSKIYVNTISDIAVRNKISISMEEREDLALIVARYTIGYGILEVILSDRQLTDVYVDSPLGVKPIYLVHSKYGQCQTNVIFSEEEAKALVSRFRALSGRPFDEAHPILDFDLPDLQTRVAVIGKPLALDGTAFALRLHKETPWTLPQFLDFKMFNTLTAGMLSFFVDAQASMLIVGSRGSGKTSLLQALMQEIPQNLRIIVQEDSVVGDSQIVVERKGVVESTTVGKLIDGLMRIYGCEEFFGKQILSVNPESVRVFSYNPFNGKIETKFVSQFTRHLVSKPIYEVITRSGKKIKVTSDHSLFTIGGTGIEPIKTGKLREGDFIATAESMSDGESVKNGSSSLEVQVLPLFELFWDEVKSLRLVESTDCFVYDFSVPGCENFICESVIAHNTQELPIPQLKNFGFNIERLKTRPPLGAQSEAEVSAEDALRTALRLGDSVLVVGEVRSTEARALYEAMRVGAVGNVVMGTIHGESAYSIWDRVVNDLGVPTTSFKATDFSIVGAPIRFGGSLKRERRIIEITEVKKEWNEDPLREGGFLTWELFNANTDNLELFEEQMKASEWIAKVRRNRGLSYEDILNEISARASTKQFLVDMKRKNNIPQILEANYSIRAHSKYLLMQEKQREEHGGIEYKTLLQEWEGWVTQNLLREATTSKSLS